MSGRRPLDTGGAVQAKVALNQIVHEAVPRTYAGAGGRLPAMDFLPATKLPRQPPRHPPASQ